MKIALYNLTTTVLTGGIETFNWEVGRELTSRGHEVHIYGGEAGLAPQYDLPVYTYPFKSRRDYPRLGLRFQKMAERWSMARNCLDDLRRGAYDVIIIHKPYDLPWIIRAAHQSGSRVAFCSGGTEFFPGYAWLVKKLDLFTACSSFNAGQIEQYCGVRPKVLYNGVDTDCFQPLPAEDSLKKQLLPAPGALVVFSAARLKRFKGFQYVIEAVARLQSEFPNLFYLIAGEGNYRTELEACAQRCQVTDRVIFLGTVPHQQLARYYSIADVALFPSLHLETFGISIAEAMSCGVPVIGSDSGGIPEVIGDAGFLSPPADSVHLAGNLSKLLRDKELRRKLRAQGRQRMVQGFTWKHTVDRLEEYLAEGVADSLAAKRGETADFR
ncbi:MAG: glycosyltransferase family 4 protein [Deltaproteobacteria bacterium]|nr:glycosyltransferase family 4 protein [Deltaproteobacteria bacterium]